VDGDGVVALAECSAVGGVAGKTPEKPAIAPAAKPGAAEMERLKFYLGEWTTRRRIRNRAFYPNGGKNTGVYTSKLGPGGNSLINSFILKDLWATSRDSMVRPGIPRKIVQSDVFGNDFPGAMVETGQFRATRSFTVRNFRPRRDAKIAKCYAGHWPGTL